MYLRERKKWAGGEGVLAWIRWMDGCMDVLYYNTTLSFALIPCDAMEWNEVWKKDLFGITIRPCLLICLLAGLRFMTEN